MYFENAQNAFEYIYDLILSKGKDSNNTKYLKNVNFTILNPRDREIKTEWRKWSKSYAETEWNWYLYGDLDPSPVATIAKIWNSVKDENGLVRSNYGYQWRRENQLQKVINLLKQDPTTRKASISLYDGKEIDSYVFDTICTYAINFYIDDRLNMSVMMRSNDLVYGFCNDQYCFSKLQEMVSNELNLEVGVYNHFVNDLHIYNRHFNLRSKFYEHSK